MKNRQSLNKQMTFVLFSLILSISTKEIYSISNYCPKTFFDCNNNLTCIQRKFRCNGVVDCYGNENDEIGCENLQQCRSNRGIYCPDFNPFDSENTSRCEHLPLSCDLYNICYFIHVDDLCICEPGWLECTMVTLDARCLHPSRVCDGIIDCIPFGVLSPDECGCDDKTFLCPKDQFCIESERVCDGLYDCTTRLDEKNCPGVCKDGYFACASKDNCIPNHLVCDKYRGNEVKLTTDCYDGSDETCDCYYNIKCPGRDTCVEKISLCEDINSCNPLESEVAAVCMCNSTTHFKCEQERICLSKSKVCDFEYDCPKTYSDEKNCLDISSTQKQCPKNSFLCSSLDVCQEFSGRCTLVNRCLPCKFARVNSFFCSESFKPTILECPCGENELSCDNGYTCYLKVCDRFG